MISRTGSHALRALACLALASEGQFLGAKALARRIQAPENYLGKLLQMLASAGLVESRKGPGGGFRLATPPESIRLLDVLEPIENISRWDGCLIGLPVCDDQQGCPVHDPWGELRDRYVSLLRNTSIADLVERLNQPRGESDRGKGPAACGTPRMIRTRRSD